MNVNGVLSKFATESNVITREFTNGKVKGTLLLLADITNIDVIHAVLYALEREEGEYTLDEAVKLVLIEAEAKRVDDEKTAIDALTAGDLLVFIDGEDGCLDVNAKTWDKRGVSEPTSETVTLGPREGFIEDIKTNLSLLNRRLKTPALAVERIKIGRLTNSPIAICYISTVASPKLVKKIKKRLSEIDIDGVLDGHYLLPYLEEHPNSLFSEVGKSEKPDIVAAKLLEGRIAIITDGSPVVLTIPHILTENLQSGEDYYKKHAYAGTLRALRVLGVALATFAPGVYVALQSYHYTMFPLRFMLTLLSAVKGIPLSPLFETLLVVLLFEILREATVRMPKPIGTAMGIVGAIVLGDTSVKAGIVSSPAIMIVALSSIALYTVPNLVGCMSVLRLGFTVVGGLCGVYGLLVLGLYLAYYLVRFNAYATPYLAPISPFIKDDMQDFITLSSPKTRVRRPKSIPNINERRQK